MVLDVHRVHRIDLGIKSYFSLLQGCLLFKKAFCGILKCENLLPYAKLYYLLHMTNFIQVNAVTIFREKI